MAQKIRDTMNAGRTNPNGRDRENKYSNGEKSLVRTRRERRRNEEESLYNRYR